MNIPLDNLYHWVEGLLPCPAVLYVFQPHGSKKISDCNWLKEHDVPSVFRLPGIIMHDQEPLDWEFYNDPQQYLALDQWQLWKTSPLETARLELAADFNLKSLVYGMSLSMYDSAILVHSEKNSKDLAMYEQNQFLCVHYWAHAVIARDWYRFAEHDHRLQQKTQPKNTFLIHCRDWSHRREYRLKFLELLIQNLLHDHSQTSVMHTNSEGVHYSQHVFANPAFELDHPELIDSILANVFLGIASANYDYEDYLHSQISVVLETVFDDSRIHLTEKILRPIACGHPFILAAGPGSLQYLRHYGFKTFAPWIDESYDLETDSARRLEKIIQSMTAIKNLSGTAQEEFAQGIEQIAQYNKQHFFSDEFFDQVQNELQTNLIAACQQVKQSRGKQYLKFLNLAKKLNLTHEVKLRQEKTQFVRQLRQSCQSALSSPGADQTV